MTIATLPHGHPSAAGFPGRGGSRHAAWRRFGRPAVQVLVLVGGALWASLRRIALATARLIDWFAEEPRRIRVTLVGIAACCLTGAAFGMALGYALAWLANTLLGLVQGIVGV